MSENNKNNFSEPDEKVESSNIFDDFNTDSDLLSEVQKLKEAQKKDIYYYLWSAWTILRYIMIIFIIGIFISASYIILQKNDSIRNKSFLNPVCNFLNWDISIPNELTNCSSVSYTLKNYKRKINELKLEQASVISPVITNIYQKENFTKTKEVSFLISKSSNKLDVIEILERFDSLKNEYVWIDKRKIECNDINISSEDNMISMSCEAFSRGYERQIIWYSWNKTDSNLVWTSMSVANSFLNYIEKNSTDFSLVNRQKIFSNQSITWEKSWYTSKTTFDLNLKINF